MRLLLSLLIILISIVGLGFWTTHSLQSSTDQLSQEINMLVRAIEQEGWETALEHTAKMEKNWAQSARWWLYSWIMRKWIISSFTGQGQSYVSSHNQALALGQLEELKLMLKHIPRKKP